MSEFTITNIQRFSLHDGPGIRITIFFKGCALRCPWCANPENLDPQIQAYDYEGSSGVYGKKYSEDELFGIIKKDKAFYTGRLSQDQWGITEAKDIDGLPGGVTLSGGEPLLVLDNLESLIRRLNAERIHVCMETSLYAPMENAILALELIDFFFIDFKILDEKGFRDVMKGDISIFRKNLDIIAQNGKKPIIIRIPIIGGFTDKENNIEKIQSMLKKYIGMGLNVLKVELLKEHHLGLSKYKSLGYPLPEYGGVSEERMLEVKNSLQIIGIPIEICTI